MALVGLLVGLQCSNTLRAKLGVRSTAAPAREMDASNPPQAGSSALLVEVRVLELDAAALATDDGTRLLAFGGSVLSPESLKLPLAAASRLVATGTARFVSNPRLMVNDGQTATMGVELSSPGGAGSPRTTRNDMLEIVCTIGQDGQVRARAVLRAEQQTGEVEHAANEIGLPLGDRALVSVDVGLASGETAIGSKVLGARNELGGALVIFVTPTVVEPTPDD